MPSHRALAEHDVIDLLALARFVDSVPRLSGLLAGAAHSADELLLRGAMRETILELSAALDEAADLEASRMRAVTFRAASMVAAQLAGGSSAKPLSH